MKNIVTAFLAAWLSFALTLAYAQSGAKLSGQVFESDKKPADGATVILVNAADSAVIKSALADAGGYFLFDNLKDGNYQIRINMVGYKKFKSAGITIKGEAVILPAVTLQQSATTLKDVTITGQKAFVERKIDRTVVNPDALISNAGTTALDVLEKSPGVVVDQNGGISLKGKGGVVIFIDDKPTYLSGTDLQNYLRSLPSSTIEQIELMINPPAKYDAAGTAGVINIKTKKNKLTGFNGNASASVNQGRYLRSNNSLNFNYRKNKINLFTNLSHNRQNVFNDLDIYRRYKNADESTKSFFVQNTYIRRMANAFNAKVGVDFYQSDKTTWGMVFTGQLRPSSETNDNVSNLLNPASQPDSVIKAYNTRDGKFKNGGANLNYRHQYDKNGRELTVDMDYIVYKTDNHQLFNNLSYFPNGNLKFWDQLSGALPSNINIYSAKTDYTHPLISGYKLAGGLKSSYTKTDNLAAYNYTIGQVTKPDYDKSNHFIYKENINAAYINLNKDFKRFSFQAGLRFENTISDGHQLGNLMKRDSTFKRNYSGLFPTLYFSYKLDSASNNQFGINYSRRINRPYYQDLNPFLSPLDKFTYYVGNPFLKPSFSHNIELTHTFKNKITTTLYYSKTSNETGETIEIVNGTYFSRPGNIGSSVVKNISVDATLDPAKWLTMNVSVGVTNIHSKSDFYTGFLNTSGTFYFLSPNAQFKFNKGWSAELSGFGRSKVTSAQFVSKGFWRMNAGVQKKLTDVTTAKIGVNDIFYTQINSGVINNLALTDASYRNRYDSRQVIVTLSYRFGKTIADQRKHNATGAESEQNRVKN